MTAVLTQDIPGPSTGDAQLTRNAVAGDKRAFAMIYDRYADRLHDFCVGMLGDRDAAADCVQDVFCTAATQLPRLRDPDKLRPWLYSVARNEALRRIRDRRRETPTDDLPDAESGDAGPEVLAARLELADLITDAAGGLPDRDRAVLELAFRHGLSGPDLADALGVTAANANTIVHRLRQNIERSLGALLVSRRVRRDGGCAELAAILDGWDGHFTVLMRKRVSRHIDSCDVCDEERRRLACPAALLGAAPVFVPAPAWLRERTLDEVQLGPSAPPPSARVVDEEQRSPVVPVVAFVAALVAAVSAAAVWVVAPEPAIEVRPGVADTAPAPVAPSAALTVTPLAPTESIVAPRLTTEVSTPRSHTPDAPPATPTPAVSSPTAAPVPSSPPALPARDWPQWPLPQWPAGGVELPDANPGGATDPTPAPDPGGAHIGPSDLGAAPSAPPPPVG